MRQQQKSFAEYDKKEDNVRNAVKQAVRSFTRVTPKKEATPSSTELTGVMGDLASRLQGHEFTLSEGTKGKVEIDQDEGRVDLRFEGKPTAEERTRLKERGVSFKWSSLVKDLMGRSAYRGLSSNKEAHDGEHTDTDEPSGPVARLDRPRGATSLTDAR